MYKDEKQESTVSSGTSAYATLREYFNKVYLGVKAVSLYSRYKLQYGGLVKMSIINSIKGNLFIDILENGRLVIGKFMMTAGPCYLKVLDNANLIIGDRVFFNHNCSVTCAKRIEIGTGCNIANNVVIVDHDHNIGAYGVVEGLCSSAVKIGNNVWLGANVVVLKGVTIGEGSIVAAGAVVRSAIPPYELWGGVPAKKIKRLR